MEGATEDDADEDGTLYKAIYGGGNMYVVFERFLFSCDIFKC
jgi:hypothetical protein